jgi:uncharacterized membrane protein (DUF106 family)
MVSDIISQIYSIMDSIFGFLFQLTGDEWMDPIVGIFFMSAFVSLIITLMTARFVDQKKMKVLKEKSKSYQEKMKEAQKKGNMKNMKKYQKEFSKMSMEMMSSSMRPMFFTFPPIILIFSWLRYLIPYEQVILSLPFSLPYWGNELGWLGWYIIVSFAMSPLLKKVFGIEGP